MLGGGADEVHLFDHPCGGVEDVADVGPDLDGALVVHEDDGGTVEGAVREVGARRGHGYSHPTMGLLSWATSTHALHVLLPHLNHVVLKTGLSDGMFCEPSHVSPSAM